MVSSSSPYDWLSIDHYCWYNFPQYYDSICQWKLNCCQTFPTKLTAQHSERASFVTQANKASSKYSSLLPICGKAPADLFLTSAITNKGFPVLSAKKFCEAIFNALTVFSYVLWKTHIQTAAALSGGVHLQTAEWATMPCRTRGVTHGCNTSCSCIQNLLKFIFPGSGRNHVMKKA